MTLSSKIIGKEQARLKALTCPKCNKKAGEVGSITINVVGNPELSGHHCAHCYAEWVAMNIPKFKEPEENV